MTNFMCMKHRLWVETHPYDAFEFVVQLLASGKQKIALQEYQQALPFLGSAFETSELIYNQISSSPQLLTTITSAAIMLAQTYKEVGKVREAKKLLNTLHFKFKASIENEYTCSKTAFFSHCSDMLMQAKEDLILGQSVWHEDGYVNSHQLH